MVQMNSDNLQALRQAMREMQDFSINTGIPGKNPEQHLFVEWIPSQETSTSHRLGGLCIFQTVCYITQ